MKKMKKWMLFLLSGLVATTLLGAAACGDDDDDDDATSEETAEATEAETEEAETPAATGESEEPTEEATEEAEEPAEPSPGVTDSEVVIGTHFPLSGPAAIYAPIVDSVGAYFESAGPINGRTINHIVRDDAYTPSQTVEATRQLIEQDQIFALMAGLGTPTHAQVFDLLAEEGIPDLLIASGAVLWTDPIVETAFAANPNYVKEAEILGQYAVDQGFTTAAIIYQNDDFGNEGREGFLNSTEGSIEVVSEQTYEANARDVQSQAINAIADNPEVLFVYATPVETGSAINAARSNGFTGQIIISTVAATDFLGQLTGTTDNLEGTVTVGYLKFLSQSDDPDVQAHVELMGANGIEPSNFTIYGQALAEVFIEILANAEEPLTRQSLVESAEAVQGFVCSVCSGEVNLGPDDHRVFETLVLAQFSGGQFVQLEGAEPVADEGN
ncbi:MAG: ABC transporter substrate-binding protein [Dehalococcoidia bacterium]|nr:ABC transporter substrate-binding protein [Dehalococcoidia bacterium]